MLYTKRNHEGEKEERTKKIESCWRKKIAAKDNEASAVYVR